MPMHARPVEKHQVFTLAIGTPHPDDDPSTVVRMAHELGKIVEAANRAMVAARGHGGQRGSVAGAVPCCASCAGLGQSLGECAECVGTGRSS
jgi:hypothetical protein